MPKISKAIRDTVRPMPLIKMSDEKRGALERWICESLPGLLRHRQTVLDRKHNKWVKTLSGLRARPAPKREASNLSVPFTSWVASGVRGRLIEGIFGTKPVAKVMPLRGIDNAADADLLAKDLQKFIEADLLSTKGLNAREVGEKIIAETVNYGTSALKVHVEPDDVKMLAPRVAGESPRQAVTYGRPKWEFVSYDDLIYWTDYGTDTQKMPYVGHEVMQTWTDMEKWVALGYYEKDAVAAVEAFYKDKLSAGAGTMTGVTPAALREHDIVELYLDWIVDDSGIPSAIYISYHKKAEKILRVTWNPMPGGVRPLFMTQFDFNPDLKKAEGQGVAEKMEGAQDETDAIHNIGVEAGKRASSHLIGVRYGSQAEKDLGGTQPVLPGDIYVTENPDEDVTTKQLGDPQAAEAAIGLEEHTRLYVTRMFGMDESRIGNVESGKRVPASLGMATQKEGRVPIARALASVANVFTEALYITVDLYRTHLPETALIAILGQEKADKLMTAVFQLTDIHTRDQFLLTVSAQDAATIQETRKQELMMLTQFLMGIYDKILGYLQLALQLPPEMQNVVMGVLTKLENSVRALVTNVESIDNPEEVIPNVTAMMEELNRIGKVVNAGTSAGNAGEEFTPNMGGGVA